MLLTTTTGTQYILKELVGAPAPDRLWAEYVVLQHLNTAGLPVAVAPLIATSDVVVGKAGGLTVSEVRARGVPLIIPTSVPGQEQANADHVVGAGLCRNSAAGVADAVAALLGNDARRRAKRGASALPVYSTNAPRFVPDVDFSDHLQYWAAGNQALMITGTAFYRNPGYHTAHNTPETLDYTRMAIVVHGRVCSRACIRT